MPSLSLLLSSWRNTEDQLTPALGSWYVTAPYTRQAAWQEAQITAQLKDNLAQCSSYQSGVIVTSNSEGAMVLSHITYKSFQLHA